jgi:hypothetical protein
LGIAAHESLAKAGEIWALKEKFEEKDLKIINDLYHQVAAREGIDNPVIYHEGWQMVANRLNAFEVGKIISIEDKFKITTPDGVIVAGAMDKVIELAEDTILVVDYKTSKWFYNQNELKSDIQLSVYDLVASLKYADYPRIILSLDYLRGEPVYTYRTKEERESFARYMLAIYQEMSRMTKEEAVPQLNDMCNWCDFAENCTAYSEAASTKVFVKRDIENFNDAELVREYLDIKSRKRIIDAHEKKLKSFILEKIRTDEQDLAGEDKLIYIRQNSSTVYDPHTVYENVPLKDFLNMVYVGKGNADKYLAKHPKLREKIMDTAKKNYTSPFLSYKSIDKEKREK